MLRICCYCGAFLGHKEGPMYLVSHGACEPCAEKAIEEAHELIRRSHERAEAGGPGRSPGRVRVRGHVDAAGIRTSAGAVGVVLRPVKTGETEE